jgi:hypothetical protein
MITLIVGICMQISTIFAIPEYTAFVNTYLVRTFSLSIATSTAIGILNLIRLHSNRVARKRDGWYNSILLLGGIAWFLTMGLVFDRGQNAPFYNYWFQHFPVQLGNMTFALIAFYIASAAYRAFRIRSIEATLLLLSASFVMLGGTSIGNAMWSGFPEIRLFIMNNINTATIRGLTFGVTLGQLAQSARNLFGIERGYMAE